MSQTENYDNLLIDFNNLNVGEQNSNNDCAEENPVKPEAHEQNNEINTTNTESMAFLCASQPLYKLLNSESPDVADNNPFDHFDKRACLSDDPFEIVSNEALNSTAENEFLKVETGTLISIESPIVFHNELGIDTQSKRVCDTHESVQNASLSTPKNVSPSAKNRSKGKSNSLNLLKYSLSHSRLDFATESGSHSENENLSMDETLAKKQRSELNVPRDSSTDDSFDDIWSTKPNLIDSQTDIEFDSDIDNDIAKLNIPMLNISVAESKMEERLTLDSEFVENSVETKAANRIEILEKFASIKQKIPQSPLQNDTISMPIHNRTVDMKCSQFPHIEDGPVTPNTICPLELLQQQLLTQSDNSNLLIENLKKLVDKYDDKNKQSTAKHLWDDLSSILTAASNVNENIEQPTKSTEIVPPQPIKRQGTFSIEKDNEDETNDTQDNDRTIDSKEVNTNNDSEVSTIDSGLSQVVKQIQNVLGPHQNINVLQTNAQSMESSSANPTYIVVMAQPVADYGGNEEIYRSQRDRSQSLTIKEKPLAAIRAAQQKIGQTRTQADTVATPIKRSTLQRRGSFGASNRTKIMTPKNEESDYQNQKQSIQPDTPKVFRRRSLQGPLMTKPPPSDPEPIARTKPLNPLLRRQSFQCTTSASGIRSPSPKLSSMRGPSPASLRLNSNTTGTLTRRKTFATDLVKDSPQKVKTSYGIMKKPPAPPAARNLKIRVSQTMSGRSNAPLRAVVPMNRVASSLLVNETVSPVESNGINALITSTPRIPSLTPAKSKKLSLAGPSALPAESPIQLLKKDRTYLSRTPSKPSIQTPQNNVPNRRRTLSDYRTSVNNSGIVETDQSGKTVSNAKNATKTSTSGLNKFTSRRTSSIGLKRISSTDSKENKQPL
ncbi:uncharacterized protein LOC116338005 [Contarinia nasturtii]|uniref:uncharacterized protein LOC116338005 n=1 Tax=Contarinia nasturtii TaxID=265458 RepID=UPI0012D43ED7|nr:uncharacterized protein LOC116338005 [Contarinia nasturtii]